jgi:transcription-repair coupling factor
MERIYQKFLNLSKTSQFLEIVKNKIRLVRGQEPIISVSGLAGAKSLIALLLFRTFGNNLIYLAKDSETKNHIHSDLLSFLPEENIIMFNDADSAEMECYRLFNPAPFDKVNEGNQCNSIQDITQLDKRCRASSNFIIILQPEDLNVSLPNIDQWAKHRLHLSKGTVLPIDNLNDWLNSAQYLRLDLVSEPGEYAVRGSIVDIFPIKSSNPAPIELVSKVKTNDNVMTKNDSDNRCGVNPIRIEFLDNEIVSLRYFDTITQRSISLISEFEISAQSRPDTEKSKLIDLIPKNTLVVSEVLDNNFPNTVLITDNKGDFDFGFVSPPIYLANFSILKSEIESAQIDYIFVTAHEYQYQRLTHIFGNKPFYVISNLHSGIFAGDDNFCVITEKELYGAPVIRQPKRKFKGQPLDDLLALNKGDYVVHIDYGIGQFENVVRLKVDDVEKDFLLIRYANEQKLYVPVEDLGLIERFIGGDDLPPTLSMLGTNRWLLTKVKIARATEEYAHELINLYAQRIIAKKEALTKDTEWQEEFEATFAYEETPDQLNALVDVKRDLESIKPMDRLICGDTGFGKTEIALRAAFKTVIGLKQVAVLVPTTILCYQHYHTFQKRFENFPVRVEMLSRFTPHSKRKNIINDMKTGKVDIVIGTHTLISPKIEFKNLGLLVIDEEHKFGVKQKEKIKKLKANLDVLTLTATPIPRTLYRSLVGLSDISSIHTPPPGRRDISTNAIYWDDEIIYQRINEELKRNGQVLFIHNRINSIKNIAKKLQNLNRNWRIAITHSKLPEKFLAQIYMDFLDGKFDILVSTAIIESGLDMPNVNTIIINRADQFGLSDLHQLRGRVGRSDKQAYAIFILPEQVSSQDEEVKDKANHFQKRISTIIAYSKLGAGFRLAMRDMELRGVGNLLGTEQHGYVNQVGLSLYQNMLKDAIARLKGEKIITEPILSLDVAAYIPEDYISDSYERVAIYKRLLSLESELELKSTSEELKDRFGKYPEVMENLFAIASIRLKARDLNLLKVSFKNNVITIVNPKKTVTLNGNLATLEKVLSRHL